MWKSLKNLIRKLCIKHKIPLTKNIRYDWETVEIIKRTLNKNSNCLDIGCHKGEILKIMCELAPEGMHIGFEPIPSLAAKLRQDFKDQNCIILEYALSDYNGTSKFTLVESNPAYSGLKQRTFDRSHEDTSVIEVQVRKIDDLKDLPDKIDLIKIDVEGAELGVLKGARRLIIASRPLIIFEHGLGASNHYGTGPEDVYQFFESVNYLLYNTTAYLNKKSNLSEEEFKRQYTEGLEFFFVAAC